MTRFTDILKNFGEKAFRRHNARRAKRKQIKNERLRKFLLEHSPFYQFLDSSPTTVYNPPTPANEEEEIIEEKVLSPPAPPVPPPPPLVVPSTPPYRPAVHHLSEEEEVAKILASLKHAEQEKHSDPTTFSSSDLEEKKKHLKHVEPPTKPAVIRPPISSFNEWEDDSEWEDDTPLTQKDVERIVLDAPGKKSAEKSATYEGINSIYSLSPEEMAAILKRRQALFDEDDDDESSGFGMITRRKKRARRETSAEAKARMAYVRSFIGKKNKK